MTLKLTFKKHHSKVISLSLIVELSNLFEANFGFSPRGESISGIICMTYCKRNIVSLDIKHTSNDSFVIFRLMINFFSSRGTVSFFKEMSELVGKSSFFQHKLYQCLSFNFKVTHFLCTSNVLIFNAVTIRLNVE